ncbi:MAG: arsenate reductase family protein [Oscillospiraceae bacterium]|jgi:arsenate reductase
MNIQIFGKNKCFDTRKAERWFKERRIKFQRIDLDRFDMSDGEVNSVARAVGGMDKIMDENGGYVTPIVRNGKQATVGYCPDVWKTWE